MGKIVTAIILLALLAGCSGTPVKLRTETVEVFKPILYCPAPNWEGLDSPEPLTIEGINENTPPGEVVKRFKATVKQLQDYAERLERALEKYDTTNEAYDELKQQFLLQQKLDGFTEEKTDVE